MLIPPAFSFRAIATSMVFILSFRRMQFAPCTGHLVECLYSHFFLMFSGRKDRHCPAFVNLLLFKKIYMMQTNNECTFLQQSLQLCFCLFFFQLNFPWCLPISCHPFIHRSLLSVSFTLIKHISQIL